MKKLFVLSICLAFIANSKVYAKDNIKVFVNNSEISTSQPPVIYNNRALIPLRAVAESMNCAVEWDNENKCVTLIKGNKTISLKINDTLINVTDEKNTYDILTDSPAVIINGTTMVPIRAIAEIFDTEVEWDNDNKIVYIGNTQNDNYIPPVNIEKSEEDKTVATAEIQSLRRINTSIINDNDLKISFLPDDVNDYTETAEEMNIYLYNRVGNLIYQDTNQGITIRNNNDFIDYTILINDILNNTDNDTFTTYTGAKVKIELLSDGKVCAKGEKTLGCTFNYATGYKGSNISMSINCLDTVVDLQNKITVNLRFYGNASSTINNLKVVAYDIRGNKLETKPLGSVIEKGEFDFNQYYTLPSATSFITIQ